MKRKKAVIIICCLIVVLIVAALSVSATLFFVKRNDTKPTVTTTQNENKKKSLTEEEINDKKMKIAKQHALEELNNMGANFLSNQISSAVSFEDDYVQVIILTPPCGANNYEKFRFIYKDFDVDKETCRLYKLTAADYSHLEEVIYQSSK